MRSKRGRRVEVVVVTSEETFDDMFSQMHEMMLGDEDDSQFVVKSEDVRDLGHALFMAKIVFKTDDDGEMCTFFFDTDSNLDKAVKIASDLAISCY